MTLTVRAVVDALERDPEADIGRAILMGARGNSGVILSQLVAGALRELPQTRADRLAAPSLACCAARATPATRPCGTRRRARSSPSRARSPSGRRRSRRTIRRSRTRSPTCSPPARSPWRERPEQLDVLKQAGVVDAGGAGLLEIVRGVTSHVRGEELPEPAPLLEPIPLEAVHQELSKFRYCTSFFVEGDRVDPAELEPELSEARRLPARGRRPRRREGARPHGRARHGALPRHRRRGDRGGGREEHARPDGRARGADPELGGDRLRRGCRLRRATATGGSSRASVRPASRVASR